MQRHLKIIFFFLGLLVFSGLSKVYPAVPAESFSASASSFASISSGDPVQRDAWDVSDHQWILESEAAPYAAHSGTPSSRLKRVLAFKMLNSLKSFVRDISFWENALTQHFQRIYTTSVVHSTEFISKYYVFAFRRILI